jgi:hypothetical protein
MAVLILSHHFENFTVTMTISPLWNICVTNDHWYVSLVVSTSRSFPHSRLITGFVNILTRRVPLVEQELLTLSENTSSSSIFSFMCMLCRSLLVLLFFFFWSLCCLFFFDIRILITSLWYLQTLLNPDIAYICFVVVLLFNTSCPLCSVSFSLCPDRTLRLSMWCLYWE